MAGNGKVEQVTSDWRAVEIYETASIQNLWMSGDDEGIHLFRGSVLENDSPGAGRSDDEGREPFVEVSGDRVLRKALLLEAVPKEAMKLAFIARERKGHQATLRVAVNGQELLRPPSPVATPEARQYWEMARDEGAWNWSRWYYLDIPSPSLKAGENEITIRSGDGQLGWSLMVADYRDWEKGAPDPVIPPASSSTSADGGDRFEAERGEYVIRLVSSDYRSTGLLVSPVLDGAGEEDVVVKSRRTVRRMRFEWDVDLPEGTSAGFRVRTGPRPVDQADGWAAWRPAGNGEWLEEVVGRYVQWEATLETGDGSRTPTLKGLRLVAEVETEPGASIRVVKAENARILRPSFDYTPEDYGCGMLRELRERFELDAVVAGAQTEWETIERLLAWSYLIPLGDCRHFPWDVLDWLVLERDPDGAIKMNTYEQRRRDKMCLYPNVALVAACLSMGIPARHVNFHSEGMTGHEIAEVWTNDYGKWVHVDATRDYYWYDPATRIPLDTLEVHQVLADRLDRVERWDQPYLFRQDLKAISADLPIAFREGNHTYSVEEGALHLFHTFCHFRTVPRMNTFSQARPLPVSQGTEVWAWGGYLNWADDKVPPLLHFSGHTNRRADFYPTMNQTRYTIEQGREGRELEVGLETDTPGFACFLVRIDREAWEQRPDRFGWFLHSGLNTLDVRTLNTAGVEGIISSAAVVA